MVNLGDIARQAGHGAGLDAMSRLWGLDSSQAGQAVEALLPAFSLAFQRLALNPVAFADLSRAIGSGTYASFFDNPGQSQAKARGSELVDQLFRSPEAAQQVASRAAALTGVGVQVMQQIMPIVAATLAGGMFRFASVEGFADGLRQWGDALKAVSERLDPPKPQDPWSAWQTAASRMMGVPSAPSAPSPRIAPDAPNVMDAWAAMVGAMMGQAAAARPATVEAARAPVPNGASDEAPSRALEAGDEPGTAPTSGEPFNPFAAMSQMFETGREVQQQHLAAFQSILDSVWGTGKA